MYSVRWHAFEYVVQPEESLLRQDVEEVIRIHEGYLASSQEADQYVKPTNWSELKSMLTDQRAALIIGQSGTGKTLATDVLYEELRHDILGLKRVKISNGPRQLREDNTPAPVLYDIEDPWGRFDLESETRLWSDQLGNFFAQASHDRLYVATTRKDVAERADVLGSLRKWQVPLEAEHYGGSQRSQLYETRVPKLPWELQLPVSRSQRTVLKELATPLEIQKFFDAVTIIDRQRHTDDDSWIREAIRTAHENSIESTVVEQIEHSDYVAAAAVVWALLKVADKFSYSYITSIELDLADGVRQLERGVTPLVQFFVAARNLRQGEHSVSYYHPRVEADVERALKRSRVLASKTLRTLINVWISNDGTTERGAGKAATLLAAIPRKTEISVQLTPGIHSVIDTWLEARLVESGRKLEEDLRLASAAGSRASGPAEIARYLLSRETTRTRWHYLDQWSTTRDEEWYSLHRSDPRTRTLIDRFIREVLPFTHGRYESKFAEDVKRLAPDLSDAFLAAAHQIVSFGVMNSDGAIAEGALDNLAGFDSVLDEAFAAMIPTAEETAKRDALHLALLNGEYSEEYAEHFSDNDDGYTADRFIKAYIQRVRKTVGWPHLAEHPHCDPLRGYWLQELLDEARDSRLDYDDAQVGVPRSSAQPDEIEGLFTSASGTEDEGKFWFLLNYVWDERYRAPLIARVKEGHSAPEVRLGALACLIAHLSDRSEDWFVVLGPQLSAFRSVQIALDLARLLYERAGDSRDHAPTATVATGHLAAPLRELSKAFLDTLSGRAADVSAPARRLVEGLEEKTEDIRRLRLAIGIPNEAGWQEDVKWLLENADRPGPAVEAVAAAHRANLREDVEKSLGHKFAGVRAKALQILGGETEPPLPPEFLATVSDNGRPVRQALVDLLGSKIDPSHTNALVELAGDKYSTGSHYTGSNAVLPIAREAVDAIEKYGVLSDEHAEDLRGIGISTDDPTLRNAIFRLLAINGGVVGLNLLFELATNPGRASIRVQAARAMLSLVSSVPAELVTRITPEVLTTQTPGVAAALALVLGAAGEDVAVKQTAEELAASHDRRVLLVLLAHARHIIASEQAKEIAAFLPNDHPALHWCFGGEIDWQSDQPLSDLGDPATSHAVFWFMEH